jgi:hypothetical protein
MVVFDPFFCMMEKNIKQHKIKNIPACTHLSKLSISNNLKLGICCPGIEHKAKMINAQMMERVVEYFRMNCFISLFSFGDNTNRGAA